MTVPRRSPAGHDRAMLSGSVPEIEAAQVAAARARLPAMQPVAGPWVTVDAAYSDQIAEKARLLAECRDDVLARLPGTAAVEAEALETVLQEVAGLPGFRRAHGVMCCPDGREVPLAGDPLGVIAALIQEDICLLEKRGSEHVLVAALLCFPASWTLAEKLGRPLTAIHKPVAPYDEGIARRVQRLFDGVQPGRPLWRANLLAYDDPALFQPRTEADPRPVGGPDACWWRSERQTVLRLPETGAVVFAIHTSVAPRRPG